MDRGNNEVRMHYVDREWKSEIEARESERERERLID